jgi:hypothetical protein
MKALLFTVVALSGALAQAVELFNGKDLTGWTAVADFNATGGYSAAEPVWHVADGAIRTPGTPFGYLRTKRDDFKNYTLELEYRWWRKTANPNSGIFLRLSDENGSFIPRCYENQLQPASVCSVFAIGGSVLQGVKPRNAYNPADALSGIAAVPARVPSAEKPFGEWNRLKITVEDETVTSYLNGVLMNRVKGVKTPEGAIGLQSEGGAIEFRAITVRE